jgi:hypothetical protein
MAASKQSFIFQTLKISKMKSSLNQILKWNGWFFLLFAVVLFSSCEEDRVTFNQAQPEGVDPDAVLKKTFQGTFFCEADSSWLHVHEKKVWIAEGSSDDGSGDESIHATIHAKDSAVKVNVSVNTDSDSESVHIEANVNQTLLEMEKGDEARYFKGYYFLNQKKEKGEGYKVRILRKTKEGILLCRIQSDSILHLLENEEFVAKEKGEENPDEEKWNLSPSRKELKKLINMGLFSDVKLYRSTKQD